MNPQAIPVSAPWWEQACAQPSARHAALAQARQQRLTKPPGSLGQLERLTVQLAALQGCERPQLDRVWISVFAADHGVAAEGVSAFPQSVTAAMVRNFAAGGAAISVLARELGAQLEVVDLGSVVDPGELGGVRRARIAASTANFLHGPAMQRGQLEQALASGAASVARARAWDAELFIGGEMGIGNTTSAAALGCALLRAPAAELVGPGTGIDARGMERKRAVVERALRVHAERRSPLDLLAALGGFEIAALTGSCIAAAQAGLPVLVDGFIATAAALYAVHLNPGCRPWLLFAHRSHEPGHRRLLQALGAEPLMDLGLRLGEGSGAAVAVPLLRLACSLHAGMATFEEAGVSDGRVD